MAKLSLSRRQHRLSLLLCIVLIGSFFFIDTSKGLLHSGGGSTLWRLFESLFNPDLSPELLKIAFSSALLTFCYALISLSIALVIGFSLAIFASGVLFPSPLLQGISRAILGFLRAIHELIWAWLFVAAVGLNPIGAVFALAIPYSGYLGKIFADSLQQVSPSPILALQQSGATPYQQLCYGYLPQAFPAMLSYTMYRLECAIRSSSVLSFVGLGGIGMQIQLSLQDLRYDQVWTLLFVLVALIILIDRWSFAIRRRL